MHYKYVHIVKGMRCLGLGEVYDNEKRFKPLPWIGWGLWQRKAFETVMRCLGLGEVYDNEKRFKPLPWIGWGLWQRKAFETVSWNRFL